MADKYFFGRTPFNNGGIARLNFANGTPGFYSAKDQAIYDAGDKFMSQSKYLQNDYIPTEGISYEGDGSPVSYANSGIMTQAPVPASKEYIPQNDGRGGEKDDDDDDDKNTTNAGLTGWDAVKAAGYFAVNPIGYVASRAIGSLVDNYKNPYTNITGGLNQDTKDAIGRDNASMDSRGQAAEGTGYDSGNECFEPNTLIQMADGSEKKIKDIQLGDNTKGGEVTGVFQFKPSGDGIYNYKGVTVAGSHFVKEDGKFIMVKDSPLAIKIDKIPVVYSLDTTDRRIFINDIEFADYNGDGVAKNFLNNAGVDLTGFDKEVLRQVEHRLI
jgi:hypothetical protein